ncbi:hypothetical protein KM427_12055 [Nocardioides sp. LMS-CY]|uniref:hypothetical protein n=1 Tax=Nocardioides sp. (strain LMS-CY) TaxID=2840457 RepID=UPI001C001CA2|nr:hypothetical protein [Nocardioides sp. LMS-CY]QWF24358.1 hypothetical protein KM427_12055 [Nocardioides sp. LMS-CY]
MPLVRGLLALGLAGIALVGCADDHPPQPAPAPAADVAAAVEHALQARAAAVRRARPEAFERTLGGGARFLEQQRVWYANLTQLPLERFGYRFDPASLVRDGDGYWAIVDEVLQLDGYDAEPVITSDRFRFAPAAGGRGRLRLVSVTDRAWEAAHRVQPQPWDLGPVEVRAGFGVLGIFDAGSVATAGSLLTSVEAGIADVSVLVPHEWSRSVVVYALSDPTFMAGLEDVPGDDPEQLDAVSFPVGAGTRFVLNPRIVDRAGPGRDRLVRHELTHVAIGTADDLAPIWVSEGLAEWVSVQSLPPEDRRIPDAAVAAAEEGVPDLPDDGSFNDEDSQAHYGLAWWAIEYVADSYGEQAPWLLLDALGAEGADTEQVLRDQWGTTTGELAEQAERLILATYR